jgi:hypothetical protein
VHSFAAEAMGLNGLRLETDPAKERQMSKLHIFIDGSWLFKACAGERALAMRMEESGHNFQIDFARLSEAILAHGREIDPTLTELGHQVLSTSIFTFPDDVDDWPSEGGGILASDLESIRQNSNARDRFAKKALDAGYDDTAIFRPFLKRWMVEALRDRRFQEKQVDTTIVALLVRSAITNPQDFHAIITGDSDILPAIRVAYPEFSTNVFVVTTHPDQLLPEARQASFSLAEFSTRVPHYFLDQHVQDIVAGSHIYKCGHCSKVFVRQRPIPRTALPCCAPCNALRR